MKFFDCVKNRKIAQERKLKYDFMVYSLNRINAILNDKDMPDYYKNKLIPSYNLVMGFISNNEYIPRNLIDVIEVDMGDKDFAKYWELIKSCGERQMTL